MSKKILLLLLCLIGINVKAQTTIIPQNSSWKYLDNGSNQGTTWITSTFNDTSWATGNAELGYGDGGEATVLSYGTSPTSRPVTSYFRKTFAVANPSLYSTFTLGLLRDDGAVIYLNGVEVARSNMPTTAISFTTLASTEVTGLSEESYTNFSINPSLFLVGNNVLAIEVHQATTNNIDLSFNLKLTATTGTCGTPISLNASAISTTTATVGWSTIPNITSYSVQYRKVGTTFWNTSTVTTPSKSLTGLTIGTNYEFQVRATCSLIFSGSYSAPFRFSTLTPCGVPAGLNASALASSSALLSWQTVSGATEYRIRYRPTLTTTWTNTTSISNSTSITNLTAAKTYEFQVQAVCPASSAFSASTNFTTLPICSIPINLSTNSITTNAANLSWQSVSGATSYNIQFRPAGSSSWLTDTSTVPSKAIANLVPATNYEFQVQAACAENSLFSTIANFTTATPPCAIPTDIAVTEITTTSAKLSWQSTTDATSYKIQYRPSGNITWMTISSVVTSIVLTDLVASTNYEFQIQAVCIASSEFSSSTNFTTAATPCAIPVNLTATNISTSTATLTWSEVLEATNYNIQYRKVGATNWNNVSSVTNSKTITGLSDSTLYEFQVQAVCPVTNIYSNTANFSTVNSGTSFIIPANSSWKYLDNGSNQGTQWQSTTFDDATWASGNAELGYGEGDEATLVSYGPIETNKYITTYFRKSFAISDPTLYSSLSFGVVRDDGVVVYLNGTEIYRNNLPTGQILYNTYAINSIGGSDEAAWYTVDINPSLLLQGDNVIAVEIHQQSLASSDLSFNGRLAGTIPPSCETPDGLFPSNIGANSATFNWQSIAGATNYNIQYRKLGDDNWTLTTSTTNSKVISGLVASSNYEFKVQATCLYTSEYSNPIPFSTIQLSCAAPTLLAATAISATSATLSWQAVADASEYVVQYRAVGTINWNSTSSSTNTLVLNGLTVATAYEYQVQALCSFASNFSAIYPFSTTEITCVAPTGLTISSTTSSVVTANWNEVEGATDYILEYQLSGTNGWIATTSTIPTQTISGLIASTDYQFRVSVACSGANNYSTTVNFTTYAGGTDYLIAANTAWKYLDNGIDQGTNWQQINFNDATWKTGNTELGYGDGDETTVISYGSSDDNKHITTYFRKTFDVSNPANYGSLSLGIVRDDGVVVYLNGTEVFRNNMPSGAVNYSTLAPISVGGSDESNWLVSTISPSLLVSGTNVLAVEIHQQSVASSDLSFNARLTAPSTVAIPAVTRGAYLQKLTPNSITIRWRTDLACDTSVKFGTSIAYGSIISNATPVTEHEITLTGLTPGTKYFYSIGTSTQTLQGDLKNNFYTAPIVGSTSPVRIWAIGDFGNGTTNQLNVRNAYMNYTGNTPTNLWIWLGDDAYTNGLDTEFQSRVFAQYPDQFKSMPLFPTLGNHDYADVGYLSTAAMTTNFPYFSIFSLPQNGECGGVPSNTPKYYSYNYANIHFISLDAYGCTTTEGSPLRTWLENDLAANTQRWTVVYLHHPPYTLGTHNSDTEVELIDVRNNIVPLLESYKVDLVLAGHSHVNERSYLIKGHTGNSTSFSQEMKISTQTNAFVKSPPYNGTVYAVCGTSGQNPEIANQPGYPMAAMYFNNNTNNCSLVIDVNDDVLSCKYLTSAGSIVDDFTISKTNAARIANLSLEESAELNVHVNQKTIHLDYTLVEDSEVKLELISMLGEKIPLMSNFPQFQNKGFQNFDIPLLGYGLAEGLYMLRITINGKPEIKKIFVSK